MDDTNHDLPQLLALGGLGYAAFLIFAQLIHHHHLGA